MEHSVTNPIAGMDMDENDEKKLYEIADEDGGFKNLKDPSYVINSTTTPTTCWTKLGPILTFVLIVLVVLDLILQGVTVHQVISNTPSCDTSDDVGATDALTGDRTDPPPTYQCNFTLDDSMIRQIQKSLDESAAVTDMLLTYILNNTDVLSNNFDSTQNVVNSLVSIVGTLSNLETNTITTEAIINDVLAKVQAVLNLQNSTVPYSEPTSCRDIKTADPDSPSGYYHIHSQIVYCNMEELCGSSDGWSRIGYLDMSDATVDCPAGLKYRQRNNRRACGRPDGTTSGSCESLKFDSNGIMYSKICGRVTGYQFGSTDALTPGNGHNNIDSWYVDGVSITRGFPRQHVWTFIQGFSKTGYRANNCPVCSTSSTQTVQDFIGNDYFCESGNPNNWWSAQFYTHPTWDGMGCGSIETACCDAPGLPWFNKTINGTTSDYVELRICGDSGIQDEDTLVGLYEIYIQ